MLRGFDDSEDGQEEFIDGVRHGPNDCQFGNVWRRAHANIRVVGYSGWMIVSLMWISARLEEFTCDAQVEQNYERCSATHCD